MDNVTVPIDAYLTGNFPTSLGVYVSNIVGVLLMVAALATFVLLVLGGIQWITAGGDKGKVEEARHRITNAIIGLTIVAISWALFLLVDYFFGLNMVGGTAVQSGSSSSSTTSGNLGSFQGLASCPCNNGGCARKDAHSTRGGLCYTCTPTGWAENKTMSLSVCRTPIQCGTCPR